MKDKPDGLLTSPNRLGKRAISDAAQDADAISAKIQEQAAREDIPLDQDAVITGLLSEVPMESEIPDNLYIAMAEILSYLHEVEESLD
jgi:type III secretion system FlhB-like substrate exporter